MESRIDFHLSFTHADEYQTHACYDFYRPNDSEGWAVFWQGIHCFQFTTAALQQFFFKHRADTELSVEKFKAFVRAEGKEGICQDTAGLFYN